MNDPHVSRLVFCCLLLATLCLSEYRTLDGTSNNKNNVNWGKSGHTYLHTRTDLGTVKNSYVDDISAIRTTPSARLVSNLISGRAPVNPSNRAPRSDLLSFFGQFITHDVMRTMPGTVVERADISVPTGDAFFDPFSVGNRTLRFSRAAFDATTGTSTSNPRRNVNGLTAFVDASQVYGSDDTRARFLRTLSKGKLKTSGDNLMPRDTGVPGGNANDARVVTDAELFMAGDVRANENPALASLHTIFLREHNRLCDELAAKNPSWDDEKLYQEARRWNIAFYQNVAFDEYVPVIAGGPLPAYTGYNANLDPSLHSFFAGVGLRYGHTEVNSLLWRLDENRREIMEKHLLLRDGFFNPAWSALGPDALLRGISSQRQQEVDTYFVDDIRNFLFAKTFEGGALDLVSINIQRNRDLGTPLFNDAREYFKLPRLTSFAQITSNTYVQSALQTLYTNIDSVEAYPAGLAEDHEGLSNVGPLVKAAFLHQFQILRDADRFYYRNADAGFTAEEIRTIQETKLSHIILRNTNITAMQCSAFYISNTYDCTKNGTKAGLSSSQSLSVLDGDLVFNWSIDGDTISFNIVAKTEGYVGLGFSTSAVTATMVNSDAIIGYVNDTTSQVVIRDYYIGATRAVNCPAGVCLDTNLEGRDDIMEPSGSQSNGVTKLSFKRKLNTGDSRDVIISNSNMNIIYSMSVKDQLGYHEYKGTALINFFSGTSAVSSDIYNAKVAHGVMMFLAWGVFYIFGIFFARFTKKFLGKYWLQAHLVFQIGGLALMLAGFVVAIMLTQFKGDKHFNNVHAVFGIITFLIALLQAGLGEIANTLFNPDHQKHTILEILHWIVGYAVMILSVVTIFLGFYAFGNVHVAIWVCYGIWSLIVFVAWIGLEAILRITKQIMPRYAIGYATPTSPTTATSVNSDDKKQ